MSKEYFENYSDNDTLIKGYIDTETKTGCAEVYKVMDKIYINLHLNKVSKNPYTDKQYAHNFANDAIEKITTK